MLLLGLQGSKGMHTYYVYKSCAMSKHFNAVININAMFLQVTPYMHLLVFHITDFIDKYGNVKQFSCQGTQVPNSLVKCLFN